jgi:hypothetical protein
MSKKPKSIGTVHDAAKAGLPNVARRKGPKSSRAVSSRDDPHYGRDYARAQKMAGMTEQQKAAYLAKCDRIAAGGGIRAGGLYPKIWGSPAPKPTLVK